MSPNLEFVRRTLVVSGMRHVPGESQDDARRRVQRAYVYYSPVEDRYRLVRHTLGADDQGNPQLYVLPVDGGVEDGAGRAPMDESGIVASSEPIREVCLLAWENLARLVEADYPTYLASMALVASSDGHC